MTESEMRLASALLYAKEKLRLYREAHDGRYVGGVEYTELMRIIDEALATVKGQAQP
jgi:hypothetical protein